MQCLALTRVPLLRWSSTAPPDNGDGPGFAEALSSLSVPIPSEQRFIPPRQSGRDWDHSRESARRRSPEGSERSPAGSGSDGKVEAGSNRSRRRTRARRSTRARPARPTSRPARSLRSKAALWKEKKQRKASTESSHPYPEDDPNVVDGQSGLTVVYSRADRVTDAVHEAQYPPHVQDSGASGGQTLASGRVNAQDIKIEGESSIRTKECRTSLICQRWCRCVR